MHASVDMACYNRNALLIYMVSNLLYRAGVCYAYMRVSYAYIAKKNKPFKRVSLRWGIILKSAL